MTDIWKTAETYDIDCVCSNCINPYHFHFVHSCLLCHHKYKGKEKGKGIHSETGRKDRTHQIQNPDDTGFGYTGTRQNLGTRSRREYQDRTN